MPPLFLNALTPQELFFTEQHSPGIIAGEFIFMYIGTEKYNRTGMKRWGGTAPGGVVKCPST